MRNIFTPYLTVVIVLSSLLMTGCAHGTVTQSDSENVILQSELQSDAKNTKPVTAGMTSHQIMLCTGNTPNGLYTVETFRQGFANILYIDYATKQQIFLCDNPSCTHDNASCLSYIELDDGGVPPIVLTLGDQILLVRNGETTESPAGIWIADSNGANRRLLFTVQSGQYIGPGFYTDESEKVIYFLLTEVKETEDTVEQNKYLCLFDLETEEIHQLIDLSEYGLYTTDRDCFIVYNVNEDLQQFYYVFPGYEQAAQISAEPFYSNDMREIGAFVKNGFIYSFSNETGILQCVDLSTGKETNFDLSAYVVQDGTIQTPDTRGPYGQQLLVVTDENQPDGTIKPQYFSLDLESGKISAPLTLCDSRGNNIVPLAEVDDKFCVIYNYLEQDVNFVSEDGVEQSTILIPCYALISQEDFYNSIPNYQQIEPVSFE